MTEDEEKVRRAVAALLGGEPPEERQEAEGHYGNTIVWVRVPPHRGRGGGGASAG